MILLQLKLTKIKLEVLYFDFQCRKMVRTQIDLLLPDKISLEFDFSTSLLS